MRRNHNYELEWLSQFLHELMPADIRDRTLMPPDVALRLHVTFTDFVQMKLEFQLVSLPPPNIPNKMLECHSAP